ncbi:MAG: aminopeptidase P family protein, partial [Candidatus Heimdallarchaeota archaeon]|nr:aminopeptidase P family protein [Candidatus Heimdallarchaeota archaeon]
VLREQESDGWVVLCHHSYDIHLKYLLEKWFSGPTLILITKEGKPKVIASRMEAMMINSDIYDVIEYKKGSELQELLEKQFNTIPKGSKIALNFVEEDEVFKKMNYDILTSGSFNALTSLNKKLEYVSAKDLIFDIRAVKTKKEIENHQEAARLAEELMEEVVEPSIKPGMREKEINALIEYECNKRGGVAFEAIVASGSNAAIPHHKAGEKKIEENNVLLIDYGVSYNLANSDITHTYWIGRNPPEKILNAYEAVDKAKEAAFNKIQAGVLSSDVEEVVRDKFEEFGYDHEKLFIHSTGHSLGLETHDIGTGIAKETPDRPSKQLLENSIITVEPGLYFQGEFGIRLEDDVVVRKDGITRLSFTPSEMKCL